MTGSLSRLFSKERAVFIPYVAAGDPTLEATRLYVAALEAAGADAVELGVPFSDPIADGPVNQRAAERALAGGATLEKILAMARRYRKAGGKVPFILFSYYNPVLRFGLERLAREAARSGVQGLLVVDLPPEEARTHSRVLAEHGIETVFLASPTTSPERLELVGRASTGFVYYVSRLGVTGERQSLSKTLAQELRRVRRAVGKPVAVGFGISRPEQAALAARHADGVIVGSALVRFSEKNRPREAAAKMKALAAAMMRAMRAARDGHEP